MTFTEYMTELAHYDLTGFTRTRLASDNVRGLLYIIDRADSLSSPAAVLSLDAVKAFNRLEWAHLWSVLDRIGFSATDIYLIKVLHSNHMMVLTGKVCSSPFDIFRSS